MNKLQIKRIYDAYSASDGTRILVDRLWPRGISKKEARLDYWLKDIAPSTELREWFGHKPERFKEFSHKYENELKKQTANIIKIKDLLTHKNVTLLYAAKDREINHAIVLRNYIEIVK